MQQQMRGTDSRPSAGHSAQLAEFSPVDSEVSLRFDALDGTAGVIGPRTWTGAHCLCLAA